MATKKGKSKEEILAEKISEAVGAGRLVKAETVDFSDSQRPPTCLEVDFPLLSVNSISALESKSGAAIKPIYKEMKWWARRSSSVFRAMLIAAAMKAPKDRAEAAKAVWDVYYANHQQNEAFSRLKVADIFMGGGTTLVEGARLGMQMYGNDLNPVAWLVVKNALACVDADVVEKLYDDIERTVKPQLMPFYTCDCPRGHKGKWTKISTGEVMGIDFNPLSLLPEERNDYSYYGPEVIYTFWAKHGPCMAKGCEHRTPIMSSPVVAIKSISIKAWQDHRCPSCGKLFDIEKDEARMAPGVPLVVADTEKPYSLMSKTGVYECPHCGTVREDIAAAVKGVSDNLGKPKNKKISLTLLVHPDWLKGDTGRMPDGTCYGGSADDPADATIAWNNLRAKSARLLEVRGQLPEEVTCPETGVRYRTGKDGGTVGKKSSFNCQAPTCGRGDQDILTAVKQTSKTGPVAMYAIQGYCPECDKERKPYNGRFFATPDISGYNTAVKEWELRKDNELTAYWPKSELPYGFMTHHLNGGIPNHGFTHWWKMFNPRQLIVHTQLFKTTKAKTNDNTDLLCLALAALQQYLRYNCQFTVYHPKNDQVTKHFANNNYHPKNTPLEVSVFSKVGDGTLISCFKSLQNSVQWMTNPWELISTENIAAIQPSLAGRLCGMSEKVHPGDTVCEPSHIECCSSTCLDRIGTASIDLVVTDPPFGGLLHYSELSDFFYVWLRLLLKDKFPKYWQSDYVPKSLEAVANTARQPKNPDAFYQRLLTECWREAARILKTSGILAFTFHHSEDEPWVAVLESLFDAGFYLEAAYPIRSDESFGDKAQFGSKKVEYDIIHVCRKRTTESEPISWAKLRRLIMADISTIKNLLEQHQAAGLPEADIQVIRRGKALEYFSRHYGKVYVEQGRYDFDVKQALVGINQLLEDEDDTTREAPPPSAEPYTRQFLRIFADTTEIPRDQMQKYLRGTGISPSEFETREWCSERKKIFHMNSPLDLARKWKGVHRKGMSRDFDQTMFMIGACFQNSGIRLDDTLNSTGFEPHPATGPLLDWMTRHGGTFEIKQAAILAHKLYSSWQEKNKSVIEQQKLLFDMADQEI